MSAGRILLTANQRLSRTLRMAHDERQVKAGAAVWESPVILPFTTWLRQTWSDAVLSGAAPPLRLLSKAQQETVWRRIIAGSAAGTSVLDLAGTAQSALRAWELVQQYRLPLDGRYSAHEDWWAFHEWASEYRLLCNRHGWLDEARLPDALRGAIPPRRLVLAGFDEFTPQQREFLDALPGWEQLPEGPAGRTVVQRPCTGADEELEAAAQWAAELRRRNRRASIGVVLLSAGHTRARLERVFEQTRDFHISIGDALGAFPSIGAALLLLRLAPLERWPTARAGQLLRSTFLAGGIAEASQRALLDARLRRNRRAYMAPVSAIEGCPSLAAFVSKWRAKRAWFAGVHPPSHWADVFEQVLAAAGWPGERPPSSREFQVVQAWTGLLREFSTLDAAGELLSYESAVSRLEELAGSTQFQPQDPGAAIQILGPLEAAGARFDHLWICAADDATWPAPAHPHPFLPLSLQREHRLPHSSPEREREFAMRTFERLKASAPDVVVSWPRQAGDVLLRPSPLLETIPVAAAVSIRRRVVPPRMMERITDETAPPLEVKDPRGGTLLVRLQSACPFRAFADLRLGARPMEAWELGLTAADRGKAIHRALELFWLEVPDHATLVALSAEQLEGAARKVAERAVHNVSRDVEGDFDRRFQEMEIARIAGLLIEYAGVEAQREPFQVAANERERMVAIGGLELNARIDRVDRLRDGRHVILDYKSNAPSVAAWYGERPDEPQMPLYAISNDAEVAAVAFAHVGAGEKRFRGLADRDGVLPGVRREERFAGQLQGWRRVLEPIARGFKEGRAEADPKKGGATCGECRMTPLCRIHEDRGAGSWPAGESQSATEELAHKRTESSPPAGGLPRE